MRTAMWMGAVFMVLLVLVDAEGREVNMGGKILKEGMELDTEQEGALPDTSGTYRGPGECARCCRAAVRAVCSVNILST